MRCRLLVSLTSLAVLLASGCTREAPAEPASTPSLDGEASERIVSLIPSATEFVYALGAGDLLVGRSTHCDYPPEVEGVPSVGTGLNPDLEAMLSLRPSLVLAAGAQENVPALASLRDAGVEVLLLPDGSVEETLRSASVLGERLDLALEGMRLHGRLRAELDAVRSVAEPELSRTLVFVGHNPFYVAGSDTFVGELLALSGVENLAPPGWSGVDEEFILVNAPDVIIDLTSPDLSAWDALGSVPAVRDGRVCAIDANLISRPGPRIGEAAHAIRSCFETGPGGQPAERD
jgi:iron complex transport system substrate-binding protein